MGVVHGLLLQAPVPPDAERADQVAAVLSGQSDAVGLAAARGRRAAVRGRASGQGEGPPHHAAGLAGDPARAGDAEHGWLAPLQGDDGVPGLVLPVLPRVARPADDLDSGRPWFCACFSYQESDVAV